MKVIKRFFDVTKKLTCDNVKFSNSFHHESWVKMKLNIQELDVFVKHGYPRRQQNQKMAKS